MKAYQVTLMISETGKYAKISAPNGRVVAEMIVDGPLAVAAYNAVNNIPIKAGRVNYFSGDLIVLDRGERVDASSESVVKSVPATENTEK